jgi:nicotinamide mononucleotide adenylyltransferase
MSVQYLIPDPVIEYIKQHRLYKNETSPVRESGKLKGVEISGSTLPACSNSASKS